MSEVVVYKMGPLCCSVCAPKEMTGEEVAAAVEKQRPCGTEAGWTVSTDATFAGGQPMPCPCDTLPDTHRHWLLDA